MEDSATNRPRQGPQRTLTGVAGPLGGFVPMSAPGVAGMPTRGAVGGGAAVPCLRTFAERSQECCDGRPVEAGAEVVAVVESARKTRLSQ